MHRWIFGSIPDLSSLDASHTPSCDHQNMSSDIVERGAKSPVVENRYFRPSHSIRGAS